MPQSPCSVCVCVCACVCGYLVPPLDKKSRKGSPTLRGQPNSICKITTSLEDEEVSAWWGFSLGLMGAEEGLNERPPSWHHAMPFLLVLS
mmetsp:Transcript_65926/g.142960  ORF Transcript_65926/g.142960 Transcript_65926/m.142960 type:complete len:90 (-) Transcript_65926:1810-2079(-)